MQLESLSLFFPTFNEEQNIQSQLNHALEVAPSVAKLYELIVIDDGSTDQTAAIVQKMMVNHPQIKLISHPKNRGYGAALKSGFKAAQCSWIFFTDADLQFDLTELGEFIPFTAQYQAILGYRRTRAEGKGRVFNAKLFKLFIDLLFRVHVKDIDCAFKLFDARLIHAIELESNGAFISAELLYKLKKQGTTFKQIPVTHHPRLRGNPTGANIKVIIKAGLEAIKLYLKIKLHRLQAHQW